MDGKFITNGVEKMELSDVVEKLIDEGIAILIVGSAVYSSMAQQFLPEWHVAATGAVVLYYFSKKKDKTRVAT